MIHELAAFEMAAGECTVTEKQLRTALFGESDRQHTHMSPRSDGRGPRRVWFRNFSTWDGVAGIYLEDLYVRPAFRRRGLARRRCWPRWPANA